MSSKVIFNNLEDEYLEASIKLKERLLILLILSGWPIFFRLGIFLNPKLKNKLFLDIFFIIKRRYKKRHLHVKEKMKNDRKKI